MNKMNVFASIAFAGAVFAGTQGISETVDAHHPAKGGSESSASAAPAIQAPLADMMAMMQMMASMQSMDSQMMGMTQRVEGRIAFLKAEWTAIARDLIGRETDRQPLVCRILMFDHPARTRG